MHVGSDYCLRRCTDFYSGVCKGTIVDFPIRWTVNSTVFSQGNEINLDVDISPLRYDDDGYWIQNLTAYNVCEPVNITCLEGVRELLSYNIHFCKQNYDSVTYLTLNVHNTRVEESIKHATMYIARVICFRRVL